jgi:hypothetical protein
VKVRPAAHLHNEYFVAEELLGKVIRRSRLLIPASASIDWFDGATKSSIIRMNHFSYSEPMNTMKKNLVKGLSILGCVGLFLGCAPKGLKIVMLDTTKRAPTQKLDMFTNGETPKGSVKAIAELSFDRGFETSDEHVLSLFVAEARKRGAQVLMAEKPVSRKVQHGDFGHEIRYVLKARIGVYE